VNPTPGSIIANRFELVRELGRGTMGTVWLAQHLTLDVRCAVKFMSAEAAREPAYAERFALEARAIAQIQSPHIVRVLDYDLWNGVPFIAMERLVGEDLGARLQRVQKLDAATTCRIMGDVARGLSRAHAAGIVHRDLKPENIFLACEGDDEIAKLVDFGIAKLEGLADGRRTQAGEVLGTPAYMSPEQARCAETIDARADLWSLGAIVFECLTGRLAFDGESLGDIFARILVEPIPVPSHVAPELPPAFDAWFVRAVCRDPAGRFADAREMADALERALDESRRARLELVTSRTLRPLPRRRSGLPLALLGLSLGVAGVAVGTTRFNHAMTEPRLRAVGEPLESSARAPSDVLVAPAAAPTPAAVVTLAPEPEPVPQPDQEAEPAPTPAPAPRAPVDRRVRPARHRASHAGAATEAQRGSECSQGQRRCHGTVLQLCNAALDGWTDFMDCGENALCDATASGHGPCVPIPTAPDSADQ
jgi:serine/threonine-protein kinase